MKQIATTEKGILVEMSKEEFDSIQKIDNKRDARIRVLIAELIELFPPETKIVKIGGRKLGMERFVNTPKPRIPRVQPSTEKTPRKKNKKSLVDVAVEIMKANNTPLTLRAVVEKMKKQGCVFKSAKPEQSLGVCLCKLQAAKMVGRIGMEGLWVASECKTRDDLTATEKELVDANPTVLTPEAKEKRKALLIQLKEKIDREESNG
jgi:hypothetical protein